MKHFYQACICLLLILLTGCTTATQSASALSVRPTELTEEEQALYQLVSTQNTLLFDFIADETIQSLRISAYELGTDGSWVNISESREAYDELTGRFALRYHVIPNGMRIAVQGKGATENAASETIDTTDMTISSMILSTQTELAYEQEIPLAVQVVSSKEVKNISLDYFTTPEKYLAAGYEHVYYITLTLSQQALT